MSTQVSPDLYVDNAWRVADTLKIEMVPLLTGKRLFATLLLEAQEVDAEQQPLSPPTDELQDAKLKDKWAARKIRQEIHSLLAATKANEKSLSHSTNHGQGRGSNGCTFARVMRRSTTAP